MKTLNKVYSELCRKNIRNYGLLTVCNFVSVLMISSFAVVMQSNTVQTMLPEGGDSRKQMTMIFILAIVGCAVFTIYASTLFLKSKSREFGVLMALGTGKKILANLLFGDIALIALISSISGMLLGTPLAAGIWGLFRLLVVDSVDMAFSINLSGYLWPLAFSLFSTIALLGMGWRFIRRSNIIDVVNEQRKSEPIGDVKSWYGIAGILMIAGGIISAVAIPQIYVSMGYTPPFWANLLYLLSAAGLYMCLVCVVVRGVGGRKRFYKSIISRNMMKFQGRQTVLNMCVIAVLIMAAYFAVFYTTMLSSSVTAFSALPVDYAFHHRIDETNIPDRTAIEKMAIEESVVMSDYKEIEFVNLAADGYDREWTDDGRYGNDYYEFFTEESFISETAFNTISGMDVNVHPGQYVFVTSTDYRHSPYDYIEDMKLFTNPDTMQSLNTKFQEEIQYDMMHRYIILDDGDYAAIIESLTDDWRELWIQFNVQDADDTYSFAKRLKNAIIDGCTEKSAVYEIYDRVEKINANSAGLVYSGDSNPDLQVDYANRESSQFNQYWRYIPIFRVLNQQDFVKNMAVFLMLFVFIAVICIAAIVVIAYTRCITIAVTNRQVYDDLRHLGANREYLLRSVRGQVSKVFAVPAIIGTLGISGFYALIMYANSGGFEAAELLSFSIDAVIIAVVSLLLCIIYHFTLKQVSSVLGLRSKNG